MTEVTDTLLLENADLVAGIARHDPSILSFLYDAFAPAIYGKIIALIKEPLRADLILEKTFVYAVAHIREHNPMLRLHTWFLQIAQYKTLEEAAVAIAGSPLPEDPAFDQYATAWNRLSIEEQRVLEQVVCKGISQEETAASQGLSLEALQLRMSAALIHFHSLFS